MSRPGPQRTCWRVLRSPLRSWEHSCSPPRRGGTGLPSPPGRPHLIPRAQCGANTKARPGSHWQPSSAQPHAHSPGGRPGHALPVRTAGTMQAAPGTRGYASGHPDPGFKVRGTECTPEVSGRARVLVDFGSEPGRATPTSFAGCFCRWHGVAPRVLCCGHGDSGRRRLAALGGRAALPSVQRVHVAPPCAHALR